MMVVSQQTGPKYEYVILDYRGILYVYSEAKCEANDWWINMPGVLKYNRREPNMYK
jgi:hypothetical protein